MAHRSIFYRLFVVFCVIVVYFGADLLVPGVHSVMGFLICFVIPGYLFISLQKSGASHGTIERPVMVVFASISFTILGSLALYATGIPVSTVGWLLYWTGLIFVIALLLVPRGLHLLFTTDKQPKPKVSANQSIEIRVDHLGLVALLLIIITAAVAVNSLGVGLQQQPRFTMMWLVPSDQQGESDKMIWRMGVRNNEGRVENYRLDVVMDSKVTQTILVRPLQPDDTWEKTLLLSEPLPQVVELRLYKPSLPNEVYRYVRVWLPNATSTAPLN